MGTLIAVFDQEENLGLRVHWYSWQRRQRLAVYWLLEFQVVPGWLTLALVSLLATTGSEIKLLYKSEQLWREKVQIEESYAQHSPSTCDRAQAVSVWVFPIVFPGFMLYRVTFPVWVDSWSCSTFWIATANFIMFLCLLTFDAFNVQCITHDSYMDRAYGQQWRFFFVRFCTVKARVRVFTERIQLVNVTAILNLDSFASGGAFVTCSVSITG